MGERTDISWCDHTFSPWWGCRPVSEGCQNCYAAALAKRWGHECFGDSPRRTLSEAYWRQPLGWARKAAEAGERRRVFCGSMCDVFERTSVTAELRDRLQGLVYETGHALDWLLLTKRPQNVGQLLFGRAWLGTTIENRATLPRVDQLCHTRARGRFLSCEPLLEDLGRLPVAGIDWIIVGGESGPHARPFDLRWARNIRDRCAAIDVPFFCKQLGRRPVVDGQPLKLRSLDGRDPAEWPEDLRVQEAPHV